MHAADARRLDTKGHARHESWIVLRGTVGQSLLGGGGRLARLRFPCLIAAEGFADACDALHEILVKRLRLELGQDHLLVRLAPGAVPALLARCVSGIGKVGRQGARDAFCTCQQVDEILDPLEILLFLLDDFLIDVIDHCVDLRLVLGQRLLESENVLDARLLELDDPGFGPMVQFSCDVASVQVLAIRNIINLDECPYFRRSGSPAYRFCCWCIIVVVLLSLQHLILVFGVLRRSCSK